MKLTNKMVEDLNCQLETMNTGLRYKNKGTDCDTTTYELFIQDKFIDISDTWSMSVDYTKEFEKFVRNFFKQKYNVDSTGFSNSIRTIFAYE